MTVRLRFAPSPTGYLHIGGVRTALYAWLYARQRGGEFVLRIEDTDVARNSDEAIQIIYDSMRWLGLDWDEGPEVGGPHGPYQQSERLALYREHAERLIESGHAYRCYATTEEIQAARKAWEEAHGHGGFRFRSPWRDRTDGDPEVPHVVRFKAPSEGETGWDDLVYGPIAYPNAEQQDFVLLRQNGLPLYNFGAFVDDLTMGITHVTRGDDHLVNTPPQILLYRAFGAEPPCFAHLPMVLGPDGKKLSKRHAAVAVLEYRDLGYVPDGVLNYLARLGWSHGDDEIFTRAELIEKFDWSACGRTGSRYDVKKLAHVQGAHLRVLTNEALAGLVVPFLAQRGLEVAPGDPRLVAAIEPVKLRATTLVDLAEGLDYFFRADDALVFDEKGAKKFLVPEAAPLLEAFASLVESTAFEAEALEAATTAWLERDGIAIKNLAQPARVAMTGRTASPGLYETLILLGRDRALSRLRRGAERARGA
ncbi:MAG: glutamate--tRNA ligase [Myxococcales bacterium]|nr:glutamate--tRNA ligase [Myxococcales bacterium]